MRFLFKEEVDVLVVPLVVELVHVQSFGVRSSAELSKSHLPQLGEYLIQMEVFLLDGPASEEMLLQHELPDKGKHPCFYQVLHHRPLVALDVDLQYVNDSILMS